jgi:hypothetical protein
VDKEALYGNNLEAERDRHKFHMKALHRAADIPEDDDVKITNRNKTHTGIGWKELAVVAGGLLGGGWLWNANQAPPNEPVVNSTIDHRDVEVTHWVRDADGEWQRIVLQRKPE